MSLSASPLSRPHLNMSSYQRSRNILGCIHSGACHLHHWYTHAGTDVCPMHTDPELCKENLQQSVSTPKKHFRYFLSCQKITLHVPLHLSVQFNSVAQSCPTLCDSMNHSRTGLPVHRQLPEFTQTNVHRVSDAIQPSHPLLSPSPPAPNPSQIRVFSNDSTLH